MKRDRSSMDTLLAAWAEGKVPAPPTKKRTRGGLILLACLAGAALLAFLLPVFISMFDIFHPAALRDIRPGDTREQVIEALGEPDASSAGGLEYSGIHFWRAPGTGNFVQLYGRTPTLPDLVDFVTRRWYVPHISVELDSFDKVVSVTLDADRPRAGVEKQKRIKSCTLLQERVPPFVETDLWYAAEYTDGSYYMGPAVAGYRCDAYGSVQTVGWDDRFGNACSAQVEIVTASGNYAEGEGWYVSPDYTLHILSPEGEGYFMACDLDRSIVEKASIDYAAETVAPFLFRECTSLREVSLPGSIRTVGCGAFWNCISLERIDLPASVRYIDSVAFTGCMSLTHIDLPASLEGIGFSVFNGCYALTEIDIPAGVRELSSDAFADCSSLRTVRLPSGLELIGRGCFSGCSSLEAIELPASLRSIGAAAFYRTGLRQIELPAGIDSIDGQLFAYTRIERISLPASVERIGEFAFAGTPLQHIDLPQGLLSIGGNAFYDTPLQHIDLPQGLLSVDAGAFRECVDLAAVELPASLQYLGASAFENCDSLRSVSLPGGIGSVESGAFFDCESLESVVIGEGITHIGSEAFAVCGSLRSVALPSTLESIESEAFANSGDANYFSVTIPASVTYIGMRAFWQSWVPAAAFEQPEGWAAENMLGDSTFIPAVDLSDPQTAARLLHTDLAEWYWHRG